MEHIGLHFKGVRSEMTHLLVKQYSELHLLPDGAERDATQLGRPPVCLQRRKRLRARDHAGRLIRRRDCAARARFHRT